MKKMIFLKLGGSLITDKTKSSTARLEVLNRLAKEISAALDQDPEIRLLLGHGSGSFGHKAAHKYGTRQGVETPEQWAGFAEVWLQASALNRLIIKELHEAGLPAIAFPASTSALGKDGQVGSWDINPLKNALENDLLPVVFGDVVFDSVRGGTIFSTEDIFSYLALDLKPERILLAGLEEGVWADYPDCTQLVKEITPKNLADVVPGLAGSAATDVTGGMEDKVRQMLSLIAEVPGLEVSIFSGVQPGSVKDALLGKKIGTLITSKD